MEFTTVICSIGHGLHTFTAVSSSTQLASPGVAKSSTNFGGVKAGMSLLPGGR